MLLLVSLLALAGFLLVALLRTNFVEVDITLNAWSASIQTGDFTIVAVAISNIFDTYIVIVISLLVATALCVKNYKRYSVLLFCAVTGEILLVTATKTLIASPRPISEILTQTGYSFPSGHVTGSIVFFGLLTYFVWQIWKSPMVKAASSSLFLAVTCIVAFDRIYLNVHWLSDVIGASLLGAFWLTSVLLVFRHVETAKYFRAY
jgi:undecaprenyl-diphosphatase